VSILVIALLATACSGGGGEEDEGGLPTEPFALGVVVGDCFDRPESPDVTAVPTVDCTEPHDFEAYAVLELDDGPFPGDEQVATRARRGCNDRFAGYVGVPPGESGLVVVPVAPDAEQWEDGNRTVTCVVTIRPGEPLQGSVEGSERPAG
jgi:hypothetical protein